MSFPTPALIEPLKELVFDRTEKCPSRHWITWGGESACFVPSMIPATDTYHIDISVFIGTFRGS